MKKRKDEEKCEKGVEEISIAKSMKKDVWQHLAKNINVAKISLIKIISAWQNEKA
jgi:hypothetical protein